uniref:bile acid-CoA:amino acid N-acyltransferase isoform X2 n=1 Tax=Ciona intestinalis TaxID=7719 RepID=UPI00006A3636|nr:bile acid-CoA:amino acid N-acyltransferase isoform X2 [Ciona intestinalis]|eukprot:XP_002129181.1 bile acid-CoA:amino acid N-acyltransferase isoform X2 [Ciona intestinalis]
MSAMVAEIHVDKKNSLSDEKVKISVTGLNPFQKVTLHSYATIDNGSCFDCVVIYQADGNGRIDVSSSEACGGFYSGVEEMGLFWGMKQSLHNERKHARFSKLDITTPLVVKLNVYEELIFTLEELDSRRKNLKKLASTHIKRWFMAAGTKRITLTVEKHGIHGTLFIPPGQGPFPAVVTLFGGVPGTMEYKAAILSSHGFVTFALAYYGSPGLQTSLDLTENGLDLSYFDKVFDFLSSLPSVDSSRGFGLICISFSTFICLAAAAWLSRISCVVWINGFLHTTMLDLVYKEKKICSFPLNLLRYSDINIGEDNIWKGRDLYTVFHDPFDPNAKASLSGFYRRKDVSYLFISGLSDENVPSELMANQAEKLFKLAGHPSYKILRYPGAGHLIEPPYTPHNAVTAQKGQSSIMDWGGKTLPHCRAQEHSWIEQIKFLKKNLAGKPTSKM